MPDPAPQPPSPPPAAAQASASARGKAAAAATLAHGKRALEVVRAFAARFDPCDDPAAEPLSLVALVCLVGAIVYNLNLFFLSRFQPLQDLGHHIALSAVVADFHRPGSLYPALYEEPSPLRANSLLYFVAGYSGRLIGVTTAVRLCMAFYLAGVPLATAYALRSFGRSLWPALLSVVLVYNLNYVAGFANMLFAFPFMILLVAVYARAVTRPTKLRALAAATLFVIIFLAHAQLYLWTGALLFVFLLVETLQTLTGGDGPLGPALRKAGRGILVGALLPVPSLALFALWYQRTFGAGRTQGGVSAVTAGMDEGFGANFKPVFWSIEQLGSYAMRIYQQEPELVWYVAFATLAGVAIAISRQTKLPGRATMEWMFVLTMLSYFVLPESMRGQEVIASRQVSVAMFFAPAFINPVRRDVSLLGRWTVIFAIVSLTLAGIAEWRNHLVKYLREDAADIQCVLEPAPPRLWLHFVKLTHNTSPQYLHHWKPTWHVEKFYMGDKFGQVSDNPAINSTSPIRYREDAQPNRIAHHPTYWWKLPELTRNFDLILLHGWKPIASELEEAKAVATRIRVCGNWQLWRRHGPWETGDAPISGP